MGYLDRVLDEKLELQINNVIVALEEKLITNPINYVDKVYFPSGYRAIPKFARPKLVKVDNVKIEVADVTMLRHFRMRQLQRRLGLPVTK